MQMTSLQERIRITELAAEGMSDRAIAAELKWKVATVRKWRRLGQREGRSGLATRLGRPVKGAMSSFAPAVVTQIHDWRAAHPGWGPLTLWARAQQAATLQGERVPSRATVGRWLAAADLSRRYERQRPLPRPPCQATTAHDVWEMDAFGAEVVPGVGQVMLINLNDRYSHARLQCYPCTVGAARVTRHPNTADYQLALRLSFVTWGLPAFLAVDHDSVYVDNTSGSPFPTLLHLWLLGLGVQLQLGRRGRPTERGLTERSHQLWHAQVLVGQHYDSWTDLWTSAQECRTFLNEWLPCRGTQNLPPLVAHPAARQPVRAYNPAEEAQLFDPARIDAFLAPLRWFRLASNVGAVSLGRHTYCLTRAWAKQCVEITYCPDRHMLHFVNATNTDQLDLPICGIAYPDLAGDLTRLEALLPDYQPSALSLPVIQCVTT